MTIPDVASLIVETGAKAEGAREEGLSVAVSTDRDVATWGAFVCIRPRLGSRPFGAAIVRSGLSPLGLPRDKNVASDLSHI